MSSRKKPASLRQDDDAEPGNPNVVVVDAAPGDFVSQWRFDVDAVMPPAADDPPQAPVVAVPAVAPQAVVPVYERDLQLIRDELRRSMAVTEEVVTLLDQLLAGRKR